MYIATLVPEATVFKSYLYLKIHSDNFSMPFHGWKLDKGWFGQWAHVHLLPIATFPGQAAYEPSATPYAAPGLMNLSQIDWKILMKSSSPTRFARVSNTQRKTPLQW